MRPLYIGMIFYAMLAKGMLWGTSKPDDPNYQKYLKRRETGFPPFEMQDHFPKLLLYKLMDPNPATRPEASEVLSEEWMKSIKTCDLIETHESTRSNVYDHHHLAKEQSP
ncbi:serine/threonine-protein kinase HAL4/sat4 [Globomyces sp. JEL0801]|nr:serine/threonine-protein kinase HAL4/sat4 [Globomyces sp. JEL0801]